MVSNPVFLFLEVAASALFVGAAMAALRRGRLPFLELISAALFGLYLEQSSQVIFETYSYSREWVLVLDRAPLVIGLTWALIIAGAMRITDALGVRRWTAPFVDAVLVIMLDLAFDAVAIRMGMWTWRDIGPSDGWFGVQAGNFYTWLFVTFGFSLLTRWLRDRAVSRRSLEWAQLLVPVPSYAILVASIIPYAIISTLTNSPTGGALWLSFLTIGLFVILAWWGVFGPRRQPPDGQAEAMVDLRLAFLTRFSIQGFFLAALVVNGWASQYPVLFGVSIALIAADVAIARLVDRRRRAAGLTMETESTLTPAPAPAPIRDS